jgi:hypothetical protein
MVSPAANNNFMDYSPGNIPAEKSFETAALHEQFKWFSILWAIASLFHMAHSSVFDSQVNFALLTLAALYVIFRPSMAGFLILIILQVFDALYRMPFTTNHWIFTAFVNVTIVHCLLYHIITKRTFQINPAGWLKSFAPLVRIELIVLYFFAVFHKLNAGFFAEGSCATDLLRAQNIDKFISFPAELYTINPYATLIVESAIPLLLSFRKTRSSGIVVGILFHCALSYSSYNAFFDFSSMVFAVYFLFTEPEWSLHISNRIKNLKSKFSELLAPRHFTLGKLRIVITVVLVALGVIYILTKNIETFHSVHLMFWTVYSILYFFVFCQNHFFTRSLKASPSLSWMSFSVTHTWLLFFPVVVFLNGLLPYLGLKTENSYAMFSNLKTEAGSSNHFLVPESLQIFNYQKDVVDIVSSTDPNLDKLAQANLSMVWFEFRNYLNEHKPGEVKYLRNGKEQIYLRDDRGTHPGKNNYVLSKMMKFRVFSKDGTQPCEH